MEFGKFRKFENALFHTVTDRYGGVSKKPYDSLNLALHVGDDVKDVLENRILTSEKYHFPIKNLVYMNQVHGNRVVMIEDAMNNRIDDCDALITNKRKIPLMVMVADCIPILFYDPVKNAIGVAHAGRNGTFLRIAQKTVMKMQEAYGCEVKDIIVGLGPSIRSCCYEVDKSLADICTKSFSDAYVMIREDNYFLDLQALNYAQLLGVGIEAAHIEISPSCTACDTNYFSYRRDGLTGRFAAYAMLT